MCQKIVKIGLLFVFVGCSHAPKTEIQADIETETKIAPQFFTLNSPPVWGSKLSKDFVKAGGFSGLVYIGKNPATQGLQFITHTDRGPNGEPTDVPKIGSKLRPFLIPDFPISWVKFETNPNNMTITILDETFLRDPNNKPITGIPQWTDSKFAWSDEKSINTAGKILPDDLMGIDPESIVVDSEGNFWMGEEYRPSILKFSPKGVLLKRFIPKNSLPADIVKRINKKYRKEIIVESIPEIYKYRKTNRGFEGITVLKDKIYAILQSPLEHPGALNKKVVRILEFDIKSEKSTNEFYYPLEHEGLDKIGDLAIRPGTSEFFAIEQNGKTGKSGEHLITSFFLNSGAGVSSDFGNGDSLNSDLENRPNSGIGNSKTKVQAPELKTLENLKMDNLLLKVKTHLNLSKLGYDFAEKVEGLAFISENQFAVINDNDFALSGELDLKLNKIPMDNSKKSVLGIFTLQ